MNELTEQLGYKYSSFMNWKSAMYIVGIANDKKILWHLEVPYEVLYHIAPHMLSAGSWGLTDWGKE